MYLHASCVSVHVLSRSEICFQTVLWHVPDSHIQTVIFVTGIFGMGLCVTGLCVTRLRLTVMFLNGIALQKSPLQKLVK